MKTRIRLWIPSLCLAVLGVVCPSSRAATASPVCQTGTLADYMNLNQGGGCQNGDLTFFRFSFSPTPVATGGAPLGNASNIIVTPYATTAEAGFFFSSSFFQLNDSTQPESATYFFGYSVDPPPIILGESVTMDPPFGDATVKQTVCANDVFLNNCGFGIQFAQSVTPPHPTSSVYFPYAVPFVDIELEVDLKASAGHPAGIDAIQSGTLLTVATPEPASFLFVSGGLLTMMAGASRRQRQSSENS